jgi:hypothetical protein
MERVAAIAFFVLVLVGAGALMGLMYGSLAAAFTGARVSNGSRIAIGLGGVLVAAVVLTGLDARPGPLAKGAAAVLGGVVLVLVARRVRRAVRRDPS